MAKSQADALFDRLRANGLRKRVARDLSEALGAASGSRPSKAAQARIASLHKLVADLEDRAKGGPAKRQAAAKKAAATRKRNATKASAKATKTSAKRTATSAKKTATTAASSAKTTASSAKTTASKAGTVSGNATSAGQYTLDTVALQAERALLIPVGAALIARDAVVDITKPYTSRTSAEKELKKFERRGNTARNTLRREAKRTRTRVERELRQRRNEVTKSVKDARGDLQKQVSGVGTNATQLARTVKEQVAAIA